MNLNERSSRLPREECEYARKAEAAVVGLASPADDSNTHRATIYQAIIKLLFKRATH